MLTLVGVHIKLINFLKLSSKSMSMYSYYVFSALHIKKFEFNFHKKSFTPTITSYEYHFKSL